MTNVHRTIIGIRSLFGGLDDSILPGLIDGEKRLVGCYDETLRVLPDGDERSVLLRLRRQLRRKINNLEMRMSMAACANFNYTRA